MAVAAGAAPAGPGPARATMKDVAALAGVSAKTVSNVLAGRPGASPATIQAVLEAASQLGYQRNADAAALRSGRRGTIALAVPTLQQPTYAALASHLMEALNGTQVLLELTAGSAERERELIAGAWRSQCDALVLVPRGSDPEQIDRDSAAPGLVLVADSGPSWIPRVTCPPQTQALLIAGHLTRLGRRRAAVLGTDQPGERWSEQTVATLRQCGLSVTDDAVLPVSHPDSLGGGVEACARLLYHGPRVDALVCSGDAVAAGALASLRRHQIDVPGDVVVIGRGDTETAAYTSPALTSVSCGPAATARALQEVLTTSAAPQQSWREPAPLVEVVPTLTVRESSARGAA